MEKNPLDDINSMSLEELVDYHKIVKITNWAMNVAGVAIMMFLLAFMSILAFIPCGFFLYILSQLSVGSVDLKTAIEERIIKLSTKK